MVLHAVSQKFQHSLFEEIIVDLLLSGLFGKRIQTQEVAVCLRYLGDHYIEVLFG